MQAFPAAPQKEYPPRCTQDSAGKKLEQPYRFAFYFFNFWKCRSNAIGRQSPFGLLRLYISIVSDFFV